jgi:L-seryl-tRNA(Ser) seleniumtransferase
VPARTVPEDPRRRIPPTHEVLADERVVPVLARLGRPAVLGAVRAAQDAVRRGELDPAEVVAAALAGVPERATTLQPVLNATGVVVHTNLGRAPLSAVAVDALAAAAGSVDVELDLADGRRGGRGRGTLAALRRALPDAGDVLVVNNGAAALLLAVTALATGREVVWSRGELVEIGDGFRLPDLATSTGATIREVGTTNRTTLADYAGALGPETGCILKVHPSNFAVTGFAAAVPAAELAGLGPPLVVDVGSGLLVPDPLLPGEPDITSALRAGAAVVTASGDKLLGGPQAGIIAGDAATVRLLRRHPLARALRVDKLTLAALEATLLGPPPPVHSALHADPAVLRARCEAIATAITTELAGRVPATVVASDGAVGGGGGPGVALPGWAVAVPARLAGPLRTGRLPVLTRVTDGRCLLDPRAVDPAADDDLVAAVVAAST